MSLTKKVRAIALLGLHFWIHLFKKILHIDQRGKSHFLAAYKNDRIFPVAPKWRNLMPQFSHCYACRLCDYHCPSFATEPAQMAPSFLVMSLSRSLPDFVFNHDLPNCHDCSICEQHCPQQVPIGSIVRFVAELEKI